MRAWLLLAALGLVHCAVDPAIQSQLNELKTKQNKVEQLIGKLSALLSDYGAEKTPTLHQRKFEESGTFIVPAGVTRIEVIAIAGGGGGRDGGRKDSFGARGGHSYFGKGVWVGGGEGAYGNNQGGRGGGGCKRGGNGGMGSGCSAGGGAAGQTSKPSDLHPGSSTLPFCGTGGSSAATLCGEEFKSMPLGTSGPGGMAAVGRNGAKYGGGGGSRAGGRAGGGGGYCRKTVKVTPGQTIPVVVGKGGHGYKWGNGHDGNGGDGLVVVAWGGNINPEGPFE